MWGIPSLAILGLVGIASRRWLSISQSKKKKKPTPAGDTDSYSSLALDAHATSDDDSGLVDDVEQPNSQSSSASAVFVPTWVHSHQTPCAHTMRTSSNVKLPCVHTKRISSDVRLPSCGNAQNDNPVDNNGELLKPELPASCGPNHPTMHSEDIQFEVSVSETDVSGEGIIYLCNKSRNCSEGGFQSSACKPVSDEVATGSSAQTRPCNNPNCSLMNKENTACYQHQSELKESEVSNGTTQKNVLFSRKDRIRIQLQLPRDIIGRFIGKQGRNIKALMADSDGAHIYINQKSLPKEAQIVPCTVQGTAKQVEDALVIIESKFPEIIIPGDLVNESPTQQFQPTTPSTTPLFSTPSRNNECLESWDFKLLPASIPPNNFSGLICYIESLRHVWMVPCERSLELDDQHQSMSYTYCYAAMGDNLLLEKERDPNLLSKFCAVKVSEIHWLRGHVKRFGDDPSSYEVQLVDYGSCVLVPPSAIKPLRYGVIVLLPCLVMLMLFCYRKEHCKLPVQAFKCQLAHVKPNKGKLYFL